MRSISVNVVKITSENKGRREGGKMFEKKTVKDVDVKDQVVLVRADYNVPLAEHEDGEQWITSDFRMRASLPTLRYLLEKGAEKVIIISHLGRPEGRDEKLSLRVVAERLAELLPGVTVGFVDECRGEEVERAVAEMPKGSVLLLENLRFDPGEKQNDEALAEDLVRNTGATLFVQDGFAVTHRAHASTVALAKLLPAVAGLLVEKEVTTLRQALEAPERPLVTIIGGAKVADKQPLIDKFLPVVDRLVIGGKIAADGYKSDNEQVYVAEDFDENSAGEKLDVGPVSTCKIIDMVNGARTVLWNGVLGKVEDPTYATASVILAKTLGESHNTKAIICGGDTSGFVEELRVNDPELKYALISTGGGAALALLSGEKMPGLEVLEDRWSLCE